MNLRIKWNEKNYQEFINYLKSIKDDEYKIFSKKLTNSKYEMLGIRLPILRSIAKEIYKSDYIGFLNICQNDYFELIMLKGFIIGKIKDINTLNLYLEDFISLIDNWSICDSFCNSLKIVNSNKKYFLKFIDNIIKKDEVYSIRVGLVLLLNYYISKEYISIIFNYLDNIRSNEYYINMAKAWLLCEVFIKYESETLNYLANNKLDKFTINKSISKIRDSYRVNEYMKNYILKYKK